MKLLAPLAALALLTATAATAHADDAGSKPADPSADLGADALQVRYPPPIVRLKLIALGLVISGGAWGASFGAGWGWQTVPGANQLKIPIVGPWIALGKSGCASDDYNCNPAKYGVRGAVYVLDGITQLAGLGLIVEAIAMKTEAAAPDQKAALLAPRLRFGGVELMPVPVTSPTMTGIGLVGTF